MRKLMGRAKLMLRLWFLKTLRIFGIDAEQWVIHYVGGSEALPPPLSEDEERFLLLKLERGDMAVRSVLIERNLRLVVYIARKFDNTGVNVEDLVSIGSIGLIKAVNTFDPTKRIKLATYASRCIENEILMFLRRNNKTRYEISLDEPLNVDWDGNELLLSDVLVGTDGASIHKNLERQVDKELLSTVLKALGDRERKIIEMRFGINKHSQAFTQKEVADVLGISQSYISRLEKRIIIKLKREMKKLV